MRTLARSILAAVFLWIAAGPGCASLSLETHTESIDGDKYFSFKPWMHYTVQGSGPPLLLVHGFPTDSYTWRRNTEMLSKYFEVFTLDLAGFGKSNNPYRDYTLEFYAAQVSTFIRHMDLGPTIVVGHSMGGAVALDAFLQYPEEVRSIVLINSAGFDVPGAALAEDLDRMGIALHNYRDESDFERLRATLVEGPLKRLYTAERYFTQAEVDRYAKPLATSNGRRARLEVLKNFRTTGLISRLTAKADELRLHSKSERRGDRDILVIWGAQDKWFSPRMAEYFRARIPGSKVAILRDAGHFAHIEEPQTVSGLIIDVMLPRPAADNRFSIYNYDADFLIEKGRTHKRRKEWKKALDYFTQALDRNPYLGLAYYEMGDMLFHQQKFAESLEMLQRSLDIYPGNATVHYRMGTTYHNQATELANRLRAQGTDEETVLDITQSKMRMAMESYEKAAALDPSKPNPWYNLGRLYSQAKDWKQAARAYGGLAAADKRNPAAHRMHLDTLMKANDLKGAADTLRRLTKLEKTNSDLHAMLGRVYRDLNKPEDAIRSFERAISLKGDEPQYALDLAHIQFKNRKYEDAQSNVNRALNLNAAEEDGLMLRAALSFRSKAWQSALDDYRKVLKSNNKSIPARIGAARCLVALGKYPDAVKTLLPAIPLLRGRDPLAHLTLAKAYIGQAPVKPRGRKAVKQAKTLLKLTIKALHNTVDAGMETREFKNDPAFKPLARTRAFKALLKRKPPPKANATIDLGLDEDGESDN